MSYNSLWLLEKFGVEFFWKWKEVTTDVVDRHAYFTLLAMTAVLTPNTELCFVDASICCPCC